MQFAVETHRTIRQYRPMDAEAVAYVHDVVRPEAWQRVGDSFVAFLPECPAVEARMRADGAHIVEG